MKNFRRLNGGQKTGLIVIFVGIAIAVITFIKLYVQFAVEGFVCASDCVNRGWEGVFAVFSAMPFVILGGIILAIASAVKRPN
jgi:hypothetical protein